MLNYVRDQNLHLQWILDTHPDADHFSATAYLQERTSGPMAIGADVTEVEKIWSEIYNWRDLRVDGSQWDRLFCDGDSFSVWCGADGALGGIALLAKQLQILGRQPVYCKIQQQVVGTC